MRLQPSLISMLPEQTNLSAWRELLALAAPNASQTLIAQQPQVLPRFADYYRRLQSLPRRTRRHLQRQCRRARHHSRNGARRRAVQSIAGLALMLALGQAPALAATINVGGGCSLVDAITAANTDNAIGLCPAGSGADTLVLRTGSTHTLTTVNNPTYAGNGLPVIASAITIAGNNSTIQRSLNTGTPDFRLLFVEDTGKLNLQGLTLANGSTRYGGGAVATRLGAVTITNATITGNTTQSTGGGVSVSSDGSLNITNSTISGNSAARRAGGLYSRGTTNVNNSTVSGNTARFDAGGLVNAGYGTLTVTNSTIAGNTAPVNGGGVWNIAARGRVTITNSTISDNSAGNNGGGLWNDAGIMTLINSTVSGNKAGRGGGVHGGGGNNTIRSDVVLFRSLISGNTAPKGAELYQLAGGVVTANSYNLFGHSGLTNAQAFFGFTPSGADVTATLDGIRPSALTSIINATRGNNGGLTSTHALVPGSPAIDAATAGCPLEKTDQRGVLRPQDGNNDGIAQCDIGAFEVVRPGTVTCDGLPATRIGTPASETLTGTTGADVIQGLGGNDIIKGLAGNDVLCGSGGNDQVLGGTSDDRLFGEADKDNLNGEAGFERCDGGAATTDTAANCEQMSNVP